MSIEPQIPKEWSDAERWAWGEIRAGRLADFHRRYGQKLDPTKPDGWDDEQKDRRLSQAFFVTILIEESFRCVTPFKGVRINGACFEKTVDLQHARLERQLWLENCRLHGKLRLMKRIGTLSSHGVRINPLSALNWKENNLFQLTFLGVYFLI